jgi:cysteine desulfurase family protein (TIGR01976 family)
MRAITDYMTHCNANHGGRYVTSRESDALLDDAHQAMADFLGAPAAESVVFGANMTTLTFAFSRALALTWRAGDEILVTRLDHDGNVTPWVLAARDAGATVRYVEFRKEDCTLDLDDFQRKLSPRTRLVAVGGASNIVGTLNPIREITRLAHAVGALVFVDAVHFAPHAAPDVAAWDCDALACSAYKFFGPHVGMLWARPELLRELTPYKLRPVTETLPGRWMTGTQNHEGIAGTRAALEYLADLGRQVGSAGLERQAAIRAAYEAIGRYERELTTGLLSDLAEIHGIRVWGIADPRRTNERAPTVAFTHARLSAAEIAERLGEQGLFVGNGNFYALQLTETLGLEPDGVVRVGLMHYNTRSEIERLLVALRNLA